MATLPHTQERLVAYTASHYKTTLYPRPALLRGSLSRKSLVLKMLWGKGSSVPFLCTGIEGSARYHLLHCTVQDLASMKGHQINKPPARAQQWQSRGNVKKQPLGVPVIRSDLRYSSLPHDHYTISREYTPQRSVSAKCAMSP